MPTAASTWQDLPRRSRRVKAMGWLCKKTLSALDDIQPGMFGICFLTLTLSITVTGGLVYFNLMSAALAIASTCLLWVSGMITMVDGRHLIDDWCHGFLQSDDYLQDSPLGEVLGYYEIDYWLERHPYWTETVAQWALANGRTLQNRHLWAIRSAAGHKPGSNYNFMLTITPDILNDTDRIDERMNVRSVADGALWSTMDRLELGRGFSTAQASQTPGGAGARRL